MSRVLGFLAALVALQSLPLVAGTLSYVPISNDANSGISSSNQYTHAIDFGTNPLAAINGVNFVNGFGTASGAITNFGSTNIPSAHPGNAAHNVSGNLVNLMTDMNYNAANGKVVLTGLTPGNTYDFRLYNRQWDPSNRSQNFKFNEGLPAFTTVTLNPDDAAAIPPGLAAGNTANYMNYRFTAQSTQLIVGIDQVGGGTYHLYGLTNQQVSSPNVKPAYIPIEGLFNTGVDASGAVLPGAANDPHWTVQSSGNPAVVVTAPPGAWVANSSTSKWISTVDTGVQIGNQTYETTFMIDETVNIADAFIDGRVAADGTITSATLNGTPILFTSPIGFTEWTNFIATDGFQYGLNTLSFTVPNGTGGGGDFGGFRLEFLASGVTVPEPASIALWLTVGLALVGFGYRQWCKR
jgi:hypothetical protein